MFTIGGGTSIFGGGGRGSKRKFRGAAKKVKNAQQLLLFTIFMLKSSILEAIWGKENVWGREFPMPHVAPPLFCSPSEVVLMQDETCSLK